LLTCGTSAATGSHEVEFIHVEYDYPQSGRSTWYYEVTSGYSPSISHVDFELNLDCVAVLDAGTWGPGFDDLNSGGGSPVVGTDPTTGVTGIKFDQSFSGGQQRKYYFTLDGNYPTDSIEVVIKAGQTKVKKWVTGPAGICDEPSPCVENPAMCDDGNPCTTDVCDAQQGCRTTPNSNPCNDGQLCTNNDVCSDGECAGTPFVPPACSDGNACTDDACNPSANDGAGACVHENNTAPCNDGQFCTQGDICSGGECTGTPFLPPSCSDDNVCTDNTCNPLANGGAGGCVISNNTAPCTDGKFCTTGDQCSGGQCLTGGSINCDDGNLCTLDQCDEAADTCRNTGDPSKAGQSCSDMNLCTTGDVCDANGGCSGTPLVCNDNSTCTADTCQPASGCVYNTVVENPTCMSCVDGLDNDGDGDADAEDCECNLLCESFNYAVVANRDSTRRTAYFGKDTRAARGLDPDLGSPSNSAPYPLGPSTSSACSQGKLELVERSAIDGVGTATTTAVFGDGDQMRLGFFAGYVPPGDVRTTGIPPFVGPQAVCSSTPVPCINDSQCPPNEMCRPVMTIAEAGNAFVDLTGTHPEFVDCEAAKASLPLDFATLLALEPTQELGKVRYKSGNAPIDVTGPGIHVVHMASLRVENGVVMQVIGDSATEAVVFQIERSFLIGVRSRVELVGGLKPDHVIWVVDRRGRAYVGNQEVEPGSDDLATLPGTLLAPAKNIIVGKKARVAGALLGRQVQLNEKAVVSHRPYLAAVP
jgi:hypothetical protein